jgi:acetyltransferase
MASPHPTLSEDASKQLLADYGVPRGRERLVADPGAAAAAAAAIGFPVVLKLCGDAIAHKTERNLVRLSLGSAAEVEAAAQELWELRRPEDGDAGLLVGEMVKGRLELIAGLVRDPQLGACVMLGLGGVLAEALRDVVFAAVPLREDEAKQLPTRLQASHILTEPFRGDPAIDLDALAKVLVGLSKLAETRADVASVDINPLIVRDGVPVPVDALVELDPAAKPVARPVLASDDEIRARFAPLFDPRGVIVAGASSHPAKFGFVTLHNLKAFGYEGEIFPVNREGSDVLGAPTLTSIDEVPEGAADLVFVCTPNKANVQVLRDAAAKGVRAAFVASGGYGETGEEGAAMEAELVAVANELGVLVAGPNGQGVISTPRSMCAQIVAPYPPPGRIGVVSQSGNLLSSFLNYAVQTGVGVSRAISCGNSAQTALADYLEFYRADPETDVALAYLEGVPDGAHFIEAVRAFTAEKPLVLVKGGAEGAGARAAASHTGSLATDDRVFDGVCRQLGALRAHTVEEAFEWAASFASQPLPKGRRTVVFSTVGGWGVLAADACAAVGLDLIALPEAVKKGIDERVPARWSQNNPIDLAGGETKNTIPEVIELIASDPGVDALLHLGIGIQHATGNGLAQGPFYPDFGLERICGYHERQEKRFAEAGAEASKRYGTPVLAATELVYTDRAYGNAGPLAVRELGRICYPSAHRAVRALRAMVDYAEYRARLPGDG